jgi:ribosomal protein S3
VTLTSDSSEHDKHRWAHVDSEQQKALDAEVRAMSVEERLERGLHLSRVAAQVRRAAWEAEQGSQPAQPVTDFEDS